MATKAGQALDSDHNIKQVPFWDLVVQCFLQLSQSSRLRFGSDLLEGGFAFLIDHQALIRWSGSIHFSSHFRQPGAHLLNKTFRCSRKTELLTVGRDFRLALLPREELVAIISKLLRSLDTDISRFQFVSQGRKNTDFQMMTRKPQFAFAFHQNRPLPLLAGKGESKRGFQVLLRTLLRSDNKLHRVVYSNSWRISPR
jgi:hypothetical protein